MAERRLSPAERNMLFGQATRQNQQVLPKLAWSEGATLSFDIPKVRLLSKLYLLVSGSFKASHASSTAFTPKAYAPFNLLRQVRVNINNGFNPFQISGEGLYLLNRARLGGNQLVAGTGRATMLETAAASAKSTDKVNFVIELPLTINERDPVGLIMTQNQETVVSVSIDCGTLAGMLTSATGYTLETPSISITPMVETFSVPTIPEAIPDLSVLKLVGEQKQAIPGAGDVQVRLQTGLTYRRLIVEIMKADGTGVADTDLGEFEIKFNQADTPYRVSPAIVAAMNQIAYGAALPAGVFVFDFTNQGIPNLGGARDYIDTERLTEFWIKTTAAEAGSIRVISEQLARLNG